MDKTNNVLRVDYYICIDLPLFDMENMNPPKTVLELRHFCMDMCVSLVDSVALCLNVPDFLLPMD